ncbi:MAG: HIT domain-containing protein [Rhodanobacteraceae bacterium]|nr:MAG: HIT domain-containing protein [Rhodanobacteraceae bacterium]
MSGHSEADFQLDPRLAADTVLVADWPLCRVLLMDDARFPWLILVPRRTGVAELDDLARTDRLQLLDETDRALALLRGLGPCDKINVGALGNIVRQLHVHVVARLQGDGAWPGPVWGVGTAQPYPSTEREALLARLRQA